VHCDCQTKWLQAPNRANCPYCRAILRPSVSHQQESYQPEVRSRFVWEPASSDVQDDDSDGANSGDSESVSEGSESLDGTITGPSHVTVSGAGIPAVNGVYTFDGYFATNRSSARSMRFGMEVFWNNQRCKLSIFSCVVSNGARHWYISIVPSGRTPGTATDIDFYSAQVTEFSQRSHPERVGSRQAKGRR
jgi:hypothetical protein